MNKLVTIGVLSGLLSAPISSACNFTKEQDRLINLAASYGEAFGYQKTLAAIVVQESFVGRHVVRINPKDGLHGSYGITHVLLSTAMWLEGEKSQWQAKSTIAPRLIHDDIYALRLAVKKLDSIGTDKGWIHLWSAYNGGSLAYAEKIRKHIRKLEQCGYFNWG